MPIVRIEGLSELEKAVERNPTKTRTELNRFFVRGLAIYRSGIKNNPWRVGMQGGGAPVRTGGLRDTHNDVIEAYRASTGPTASYALFVHEGTSKMKARPWLDSVKSDKQKDIDKLAEEMLENIVKDLAK